MKFTRLKAVLATALVAGAGASAWADDAPEEEVVAFGEATFWLGGDEVVVATGEGEFWLGPDEIAVAAGEKEFALMPNWAWQVGDAAFAITNDIDQLIVFGEGAVGDSSKWPTGLDRDAVKRVVVQDGVTGIGARFFNDCTNVKTMSFGKDVVTFGENAFYKCFSLETITVANEGALDSLKDSVTYRLMYDAEGNFVVAPKIEVAGYVEMLYGKETLTDADWVQIGKLSEQNLEALKEANLYHFFQTRLVKESE